MTLLTILKTSRLEAGFLFYLIGGKTKGSGGYGNEFQPRFPNVKTGLTTFLSFLSMPCKKRLPGTHSG
jgi:hypothetical protein